MLLLLILLGFCVSSYLFGFIVWLGLLLYVWILWVSGGGCFCSWVGLWLVLPGFWLCLIVGLVLLCCCFVLFDLC